MKTSRIILSLLLMITSAGLLYANKTLQEETKTLNAKSGGTLYVNLDPGDVRISVWNKDQVLIKVKGLEKDELRDLSMYDRSGDVYVEFESSYGWSHDAKFYISIPSKYNVDIKTTGGDIYIEANITGRMEASTNGGDIDFRNVKGDVIVSTSGGDIKCGDVNGRLSLNTQGGDIRVGKVTGGRADVSTMGGDVRIDDVSGGLDLKTYGGDIDVGNVGGSASVVTYGGDINISKVNGDVDMSTYGGDLALRGANGHVKASTYGGNITLLDVVGSVEAKTAAGRVFVELTPKGTGRNRIKTSSGEIALYIPSNAKVTIEAEIEIDGYRNRKYEEATYKIYSDFKYTSYVNDDNTIFAVYELNGGGEKIKLETTNSNIKLKKLVK